MNPSSINRSNSGSSGAGHGSGATQPPSEGASEAFQQAVGGSPNLGPGGTHPSNLGPGGKRPNLGPGGTQTNLGPGGTQQMTLQQILTELIDSSIVQDAVHNMQESTERFKEMWEDSP